MFEKLQQMEENYSILQEKLNQPETYDDPKVAARLNRELKELEEVVSTYRMWEACRQNCDELEGLLHSDDPELRRWSASCRPCSFPRTQTTARASSSRCVPGWAAKRPPFLPTLCAGCTVCTA